MRRLITGLTAALLLASVATVAVAHRGELTGSADCDSWFVDARVFDIGANRYVEVVTTIPGTTGLYERGFSSVDPLGLLVWAASGDSPVSGTVTLSIYGGGYGEHNLEHTTSLTIESPADCGTEPPPPPPTPIVTEIPDTSTAP